MTNTLEEQWKPIMGYEGLYEVSNMGRVRSIRTNGQTLKPSNQGQGYLSVSLSKKNVARKFLVHRLVASAFVEKPSEDANTVNHINEDKTDNRAANLEWLTLNENLHYGTGIYRGHANRDKQWHREHRGGLNPAAKKIAQYTIEGEFLKQWDCVKDAATELGLASTTIIGAAKGRTKSAGGFKWKYIL